MIKPALLFALAATLSAQTPLPLEGIAKVSFKVTDLEDARAYYGGVLGFQTAFGTNPAIYKVSEDQYIELLPGLKPDDLVRLQKVVLQTSDVEALRRGLTERGLQPSAVKKNSLGDPVISLRDPEDREIEFVQYAPDGRERRARGQFADNRRLSTHLQHVGVDVPSDRVDAAMHFYHDQLGFQEFWRYSPGGELRLIKLLVPGSRRDIVELMIYNGHLTKAQFGSMHHINFEVAAITPPFHTLMERHANFKGHGTPVVNAENIWAMNLFDPDGTRTEIQDLKKVPALRLGVVGLDHGHVGGFFRRMQGHYDWQIAGIVDPSAELGARYAAQNKIDSNLVFTNLEKMLDTVKPVAVVVFSNTFDHGRVVEACAARGIHVMMEKPLAVDMDQARAMKAASEKGHIHVLVNYETTWHPSNGLAIRLAKEDGALGEIRKMVAHDGHSGPKEIGVGPEFFAWLTDPKRNGAGAMFDFGCYGADLMTLLMDGQTPLTVTATAQQFKPEIYPKVDDEANILVTYPGAVGIIEASWNWPFDRKDLEIYGRTGFVKTVGMDRAQVRLKGRDMEEVAAPPLDPGEDDPLTHFSAVVRGEIKPDLLSAFQTNYVVTQILDAARRSAKTGKTIRLVDGQ